MHTPGPWIARRGGQPTAGWTVSRSGGSAPILARLGDGRDRRSPSGIAADARLMASAPRLLASLRILVLLMRRHLAGHAADGDPAPDRRVVLTACAAAASVIADVDGPAA
jgi:hypothetical protein